MNTNNSTTSSETYSAKKMAKPIHFFCKAIQANSVCLIGDFNDWNPASHPMQRRLDGFWAVEVPLTRGHHEYLFLVDGKSRPDAQAMGAVRNERNELVSIIAVS